MRIRTISAKGLATRDRILEVAADLIHAKGFNYTGVQEILDKAGVPKGSFYFYFDSKEALGLEIIERHLAVFRDQGRRFLAEGKGPPLTRLRRMFQWFQDYYAETGFTRGCPLGNLTQEMADLNPLFRERIHRAMETLAGALAAILDEARQRGEVPAHIQPDKMGRFIVASWQGALLLMKLSRSPAPLKRMETLLFDQMLKPDVHLTRSVIRTAARPKTPGPRPTKKGGPNHDASKDRPARKGNRPDRRGL